MQNTSSTGSTQQRPHVLMGAFVQMATPTCAPKAQTPRRRADILLNEKVNKLDRNRNKSNARIFKQIAQERSGIKQQGPKPAPKKRTTYVAPPL